MRRAGAPGRVDHLLRGRGAKPLVFVLCLLPLAWLLVRAATDALGANPAQALVRASGDWALRFLCIALAVTPVRIALGWTALARWRRMLGVYAWFYALLHLLCYAWFDMGFDWAGVARDIPRRPFILVGFAAFVLLSALAATSFDRALRALGGRRWRVLHRSVYAAAGLALLHFWWMRAAKNDVGEVLVYGAIVAALLGWRVWQFIQKNRRPPARRLGE